MDHIQLGRKCWVIIFRVSYVITHSLLITMLEIDESNMVIGTIIFGSLCYLIAQGIQIYDELTLKAGLVFPGYADVFWMMMTIYYLVAMLNKISRIKNLYIVFHFLLDTFIIISVAVMASWNYLIYPRLQVAATSESLLYNIVSVGYPIGDLGLLLGVFMLCLYPGELLSKKGMCCFVSGLSILIFADSAYVYLGATNNDTVSNLIGPVWALSILVLGLVGSYSKDKNEEVDIDKKCL